MKDPSNPMPRSAKALTWVFGNLNDRKQARLVGWFVMIGGFSIGVAVMAFLPTWVATVALLIFAALLAWALYVAIVYLRISRR